MPDSVRNQKPTKNALASYMVKPPGVQFETQDRKEKIVLLLRRHFLTNLSWIVVAILMLLLPMAFWFLPLANFLPLRFQIVLILMWYMFVAVFVFENFLTWYYNVYIVTDERIVDVDFYSLIYKKVSQAKIDNIQDVTFVMGGLARSMMNFGDVFIQTAGEQREFDFNDVPRPDVVAKLINELILEEEREKLEGRVM